MKFPKLLFLSIFLIGCDATPPVKIADPRPAMELSLIKKFHTADSLYTSESNEIKKKEIYDKQKTELITFIKDSLPSEVKQWYAFVYQIEVVRTPVDYVEVTLLIPKNTYLDDGEKYPQYSNIVLSSKVSFNDSSVKDSLKELSKDDKVLVTGSFEKGTLSVGLISNAVDGTNDEFIFANPKFEFNIKSIVKQGK